METITLAKTDAQIAARWLDYTRNRLIEQNDQSDENAATIRELNRIIPILNPDIYVG